MTIDPIYTAFCPQLTWLSVAVASWSMYLTRSIKASRPLSSLKRSLKDLRSSLVRPSFSESGALGVLEGQNASASSRTTCSCSWKTCRSRPSSSRMSLTNKMEPAASLIISRIFSELSWSMLVNLVVNWASLSVYGITESAETHQYGAKL